LRLLDALPIRVAVAHVFTDKGSRITGKSIGLWSLRIGPTYLLTLAFLDLNDSTAL